jgi:hypothetical protein
MWSFGYPTIAAVTMCSRVMISGLSSLRAIAISSVVLVVVEGALRIAGPTKQFTFNTLWHADDRKAMAAAYGQQKAWRAAVRRGEAAPHDPHHTPTTTTTTTTTTQHTTTIDAEAEVAAPAVRSRSATNFFAHAVPITTPDAIERHHQTAEAHSQAQSHATHAPPPPHLHLPEEQRHRLAQNKVVTDRILTDQLAHAIAIMVW